MLSDCLFSFISVLFILFNITCHGPLILSFVIYAVNINHIIFSEFVLDEVINKSKFLIQ